MHVGLKVWSTNDFYWVPIRRLHGAGVFDFLELFVVPDSDSHLSGWKSFGVPWVLHAPHAHAGLNMSLPGRLEENSRAVRSLEAYALELSPRAVIFHPGVDGTIEETVRQVALLRKQYPASFRDALIENKPAVGLKGEACLGSTPAEIKELKQETTMGFCFDFGHAVCAAATNALDPYDYCSAFLPLSPAMYHLSDGLVGSTQDQHLNLGGGNFDFAKIAEMLPGDAWVSLETNKCSKQNLDDFQRDVEFFRKVIDANRSNK